MSAPRVDTGDHPRPGGPLPGPFPGPKSVGPGGCGWCGRRSCSRRGSTGREGARGVVDDEFTEVLVSAGLLLVIGPLGLAAFVFAARPPGPAFYRARLRGPAIAIGSLLATVLVMSFG
ncbi:hypothetical protein ACGFYY_21905 [Streptomyces sp. NPDC048331]|uniref:hypothetical protein n=1 Tax=Streptomyces sp. NPDC048331 TaxID=3365534 RepID=UPI003710135C